MNEIDWSDVWSRVAEERKQWFRVHIRTTDDDPRAVLADAISKGISRMISEERYREKRQCK